MPPGKIDAVSPDRRLAGALLFFVAAVGVLAAVLLTGGKHPASPARPVVTHVKTAHDRKGTTTTTSGAQPAMSSTTPTAPTVRHGKPVPKPQVARTASTPTTTSQTNTSPTSTATTTTAPRSTTTTTARRTTTTTTTTTTMATTTTAPPAPGGGGG